MGRRGGRAGCQVTRFRGERGRAQHARAPPGTGAPCSQPSPPLPASPLADITCGADGDSWEWEGWGGAGTKEPGAPDRAERAAHLAPGTRHLLRAHRLSGQGVGLERCKDIARGQDGFESTEAMNSVNQCLWCSYCVQSIPSSC